MLNKYSVIIKKKDGYHIYSHDKKKHLGGPYSLEKAKKRLKQIEYFKHKHSSHCTCNLCHPSENTFEDFIKSNNIYIGTVGFNNSINKDNIYKNASNKEKIKLYSQYFNSVETKAFETKMPDIYTLNKWYEETPNNFKFSIRAGKFSNPIRILTNSDDFNIFFDRCASILKEKLGPIILTFPHMIYTSSIKKYFNIIPNHNYALDIMSKRFYNSDMFNVMAKKNLTFVREYIDGSDAIADWDYYSVESLNNIDEIINTGNDVIYIYQKASAKNVGKYFHEKSMDINLPGKFPTNIETPNTMTFDTQNPGPKMYEDQQDGIIETEADEGWEEANRLYPNRDTGLANATDPKNYRHI